MSVLSDLRKDTAAKLAGLSVPVLPSIPEQLPPPCAFLSPGSPYVETNFEGKNFGESLVNFELTLVVDAGGNDVQSDALDDLLVEALAVIDPIADLYPGSAEPGVISMNGQSYLACFLTVSRITRL